MSLEFFFWVYWVYDKNISETKLRILLVTTQILETKLRILLVTTQILEIRLGRAFEDVFQHHRVHDVCMITPDHERDHVMGILTFFYSTRLQRSTA